MTTTISLRCREGTPYQVDILPPVGHRPDKVVFAASGAGLSSLPGVALAESFAATMSVETGGQWRDRGREAMAAAAVQYHDLTTTDQRVYRRDLASGGINADCRGRHRRRGVEGCGPAEDEALEPAVRRAKEPKCLSRSPSTAAGSTNCVSV